MVVVSGTGVKGISTPPARNLLEGHNGAVVGGFGLEGAALDGNGSREFVPDGGQVSSCAGYHARCPVSLDSAKAASETAPVEVPG